MSYNTLDWKVESGILVLTLNRPDKLNAFTVEMANELIDAFTRVNTDSSVSAVVVTGAGRAFCAGMDLSVGGNVFGLDESQQPTLADMHKRLDDPAIVRGVRDTGGRVTLAIYDCTKPVIAAINGAGVGIGATMTLAMDVRLMSEAARLGFVFGRIGITPEACSTWFLPRIVGPQQALDWFYRADLIAPDEALAAGLIKAVHAPGDLINQALALAHRYVDNRSPVATALTRQMVYRNAAQPHPLEAHRVDSLAIYYASFGDGMEGVNSFLEKRTPQFKTRLPADLPPFYGEWTGQSD
jgi:enoyl-CoA hydratase/carnithine racemase